MTSTHYDVLIIGSGFGGSVTAMRLAEKGYRVGVLEAGKRYEVHCAGMTRNQMKLHIAELPG